MDTTVKLVYLPLSGAKIVGKIHLWVERQI